MKILMLVIASLSLAMAAIAQTGEERKPPATSPSVSNRLIAPDLREGPFQQAQQSDLQEQPSRTNQTLDANVTTAPSADRLATPVGTEPVVESEFEQMVRESVGHPLPVFGQELFRNVPSTFAPVDHVPVTSNYVIGPGDELVLRAWGALNFNLQPVVDRNGFVHIPKVGDLSVAGLRYEQLSGYMRSSIGRLYRNFDLTVTLGQLRSIQVFVVGYARRPGSYTVSSLSTLVNTIFAAGGPSPRGSMRRIELRRGAVVAAEFDLYGLLLHGDKSNDLALLPGDVIYIPPVGITVAVDGSVQAPGIYEARNSATLAEMVEIAGGLTPTAGSNRVVIERIEQHKYRRILEASLSDGTLPVANGDVIRITPVLPKFDDTVTLRGNVAEPGRYAFRFGMHVRDLIPSREFLVTREYWKRQNQLVNETAVKPTLEMTELRNEVQRDGGDINWAYALVQRMQPDLSTQLLPFDLGRALDDPASKDNLELKAGDVITIFSQKDIAVPAKRQSRYVRLEGEISAAGVYRAEPGESLRHLLQRAGGLTTEAYPFAAQFTRESVKAEQTERYKRYLDELDKELSHQAGQPGVDRQAAEAKALEVERQQKLVAELRKVQPTGRIVLGLQPNDRSIDAFPEMEVEDGDKLFIPRQPSTVSVMGAVYNENAFLYTREQSAQKYLRSAGGGTREADEGKTFILRADGSLLSRQMWTRQKKNGFDGVLPGDTIVVPLRLERSSFLRNLKDWSQVISQFALGAAAIRVLEN